jgi:hypothetical protein
MVTTWLLRNGPDLPEAAVLFALALERDGHTLSVQTTLDNRSDLLVSNRSTLTREQVAGIKTHRTSILALLAYDAPEPR